MMIDLDAICQEIERSVPTARATAVPWQGQVIVTFTNRPEVEVNLLTPYYQRKISNGRMEQEELSELIQSVERIGGFAL